jgi:hypothetical protein
LNLVRRHCPEAIPAAVAAKAEFMSRLNHLAAEEKFF